MLMKNRLSMSRIRNLSSPFRSGSVRSSTMLRILRHASNLVAISALLNHTVRVIVTQRGFSRLRSSSIAHLVTPRRAARGDWHASTTASRNASYDLLSWAFALSKGPTSTGGALPPRAWRAADDARADPMAAASAAMTVACQCASLAAAGGSAMRRGVRRGRKSAYGVPERAAARAGDRPSSADTGNPRRASMDFQLLCAAAPDPAAAAPEMQPRHSERCSPHGEERHMTAALLVMHDTVPKLAAHVLDFIVQRVNARL